MSEKGEVWQVEGRALHEPEKDVVRVKSVRECWRKQGPSEHEGVRMYAQSVV